MTDDQFFEMCQRSEMMVLERGAEMETVSKPLAGFETGVRSSTINTHLSNWSREDGSGACFGAFTGFRLPNNAIRAPYSSWVLRSRLALLAPEQKKKFLPLCPNFAIELRSPSDDLDTVKAKMEEYLSCGLRLGWLIDPEERAVYVYRPGVSPQKLENLSEISSDPELPGFVLDLRDIWDPQI